MADAASRRSGLSQDPVLTVDGDGVVVAWVRCRSCGYRLFGLRSDGRCPECGEEIAVSTRMTVLRSLSSAQIGELRRGSGAVGFTLIVSMLAVAVVSATPPIAVLMLPLAVISSFLAIIAAANLQVDAPLPVASAASGFVACVIAVPLVLPILGAIAIGSVLYAWDCRQTDAGDWFVFAVLALFGGVAGGLVLVGLLQPVYAFARLIDRVFVDHDGIVGPARTRPTRVLIRFGQVAMIAAAVVVAFAGHRSGPRLSLAVALPGGLAVFAASVHLLFVIADVRRELTGVRTEARDRERFLEKNRG